MDSTGPGEAGVLAWCSAIRFNMAGDAGRESLDTQIQKHGFDFLESYLDSVLSRAKEEPMYELLKTPGKRRDAPKRTRAATAAVAKLKAINSMVFEETESVPPKQHAEAPQRTNGILPSSSSPGENAFSAAAIKKALQKVVTIADSPEKMDVDEQPLQTVQEDVPMSPSPSPPPRSLPNDRSTSPVTTKEAELVLSHNVQVPQSSAQSPSHGPAEPGPSSQHAITESQWQPQASNVPEAFDTTHTATPLEPLPTSSSAQEATLAHPGSAKELSMIAEADEPSEQPRLSPVRPAADAIAEQDEDDAVPIRAVPFAPADQDAAVPLRDAPGPSLKRKPSAAQFAGLPAPSPLRKSLRLSHDPAPPAHTPGAGLGKRTSWLSRAKEAKALERTGPARRGGSREGAGPASAAVGIAKDVQEARQKSGELLGLGAAFPSSESVAAEEKKAQEGTTVESGALAFLRNKRNASSLENAVAPVEQPKPQLEPQAQPQPPSDPQPQPQTQPQPQPPRPAPAPLAPLPSNNYDAPDDFTVPLADPDAEEHTLHRLKATVQGARAGKGTGKSLGGNAAAALAEARKAAEARVAQRNKTEEPEDEGAQGAQEDTSPLQDDPSRRMSVSDLMTDVDRAQAARGANGSARVADLSTSTTPPHSPPPALSRGSAAPAPAANPAVFSKPPTVFVAPPKQPSALPPAPAPAGAAKFTEAAFTLPVANPFSLPAALTLGVPARLPSPDAPAADDHAANAAPAWRDALQDDGDDDFALRPGGPQQQAQESDDDMDDDSWRADGQLQAGAAWTPFGFAPAPADDTATWSSAPSRSTSQRGGDTRVVEDLLEGPAQQAQTGAEDLESDFERAQGEVDEEDLRTDDMEIDEDYPVGTDAELEELIAAGKPTVTLVKQPPRAPSQLSMASTSSSQSQLGIFGHAGRFVSSMLGASKAAKTKGDPVKSIARAAAVAKKQQEEADKKATRLKEMEARRQQAQQRKAEEEKARIQEEEKKIREEAERRKREREEYTDKRPLKPTKKVDDDTTQKRKINVEAEKKAGPSKPPSKDAQSSRTIKPPSASTNAPATATKAGAPLKSALSKQTSTTSIAAAASSSSIPRSQSTENKPSKIATSSNSKLAVGKGKAKAQDSDDPLPSKLVQSQMANRAKAQMTAQQTPKQAPPVTSESIELPDINSEYSDSEDESRPRFDAPEWAQSPELRQQLEQQSRMNPDDIFGRIGPLRMEEIFRTRQSRFRARTSSANWAGADQLTAEEEREYARRMGFE